MAETDERIETYINRSGVQGDTEFMLVQLNAIYDALNKANSIKLTLGRDSSFQAATTNATELKKATDSLSSSVNSYASVQKQANQITSETIASYTGGSEATLRQANVLAGLKLQLSQNTALQKEYKVQLDSGVISLGVYQAKMAEAIITQKEYQAAISNINKELTLSAKADLAIPGTQGSAQAQNALLGAERRSTPVVEGIATDTDLQKVAEMNALIDKNNELIDANSDKLAKQKINIGNYPTAFTTAFGTLEQELGKVNVALQAPGLSGKQIADLTLKQNALQNATALVSKEFSTTTAQSNAYKESAKQVGAVYGTNSELFKTYAAQVAAGATETTKLGEAVAAAGPKGNIFAAGFRNIYSTLRQVAYAIPGIGLAGLIGLLLEPLGALASSLFNVGNKTVDLKDKQAILQDTLKRTSEVLDSLSSEAGKGAIEVDNLKNHIQEAKQGLISSNDVVELYNSTIGKTTGAVNNLADAEDQIAKKGDAYIKYTILKAAAQLAAAKSAAALVEAEVAAEKPAQDFNTIGSRLTTFGAGQVSAPGGVPGGAAQLAAGLQARNDAAKAAQDKAIAQKKNESDEFLKVEAKFVADYEKIASALGFNPDGDKIKESNEKAITSLDLQIEALTRYQNKQNEVAQTDTNTYEKRRQAMVNFNAAAAKLVELNSLKSFIGVTNTNQQDQLAAKLLTDQQKTAIDGYAKLQALDESYRQRKLSAEEQMAEDEINVSIKSNEAIYKNDQKSLQDRLLAYQAYVSAQAQLLEEQKNSKLSAVGFSPQEISDFNNGLQVQVQGKRITNDELLALEKTYESSLATLSDNGAKNVYDIVTSYAKKTQDDLRTINKQNIDNSILETYSIDLGALNKSFELQIISAIQYQTKRKRLDRDFVEAQYQAQIDGYDKSLAADQAYEQELNTQIQKAAQDLINSKEIGADEEIKENEARLEALKKAEQKNADDILQIQEKLLKAKADKAKAAEQKALADAEKENAQEITLLKTVVSGIGTIVDARYDNEKAQIQATMAAINKKAQSDIDAENASSDSAQEKQDKIEAINERAAAQNAQLAAQQKQIDIDKARFDKAKAIADIAINTAVAITKVMDEPFLIALIAATGAAEAAIVAATPIPTYKYGAGVNGRPKHPGGEAEVGHGKKELAITPAGQLIVTPSIPTRMTFPRDTVVLPDANAAIDALIYSSLRGFDKSDNSVADDRLLQSNQQLHKELRRLQNIVSNKQETHIHTTWSGLERSYRSGKNWLQFIDEKINWKL